MSKTFSPMPPGDPASLGTAAGTFDYPLSNGKTIPCQMFNCWDTAWPEWARTTWVDCTPVLEWSRQASPTMSTGSAGSGGDGGGASRGAPPAGGLGPVQPPGAYLPAPPLPGGGSIGGGGNADVVSATMGVAQRLDLVASELRGMRRDIQGSTIGLRAAGVLP